MVPPTQMPFNHGLNQRPVSARQPSANQGITNSKIGRKILCNPCKNSVNGIVIRIHGVGLSSVIKLGIRVHNDKRDIWTFNQRFGVCAQFSSVPSHRSAVRRVRFWKLILDVQGNAFAHGAQTIASVHDEVKAAFFGQGEEVAVNFMHGCILPKGLVLVHAHR